MSVVVRSPKVFLFNPLGSPHETKISLKLLLTLEEMSKTQRNFTTMGGVLV